ncbi:unnamed protein product [Bathycoccus prasinos]
MAGPSQQQPPHSVKIGVELVIKLCTSARSSGKKPLLLFSLCCIIVIVMLLVVDGGNALGFSPSVSTIQTTIKEEKEKSSKKGFEEEDKTLDFWKKLANIALFAACATTIGILVLARRARKSSHIKIEGQPATIPANTSGQQKSWNGSHWVEQTTKTTSVLSSPYRNSPSTTTSSSSSRPPDANWAKAKAPTSVCSKGSESVNTNGTTNNGTLDEDKTEFATGFGYSEGATSETARERAYRETLWARREAEELEAEENEEDQRNHHEYFTKHEEKEDRRGNTSTNTRQHQHQQKPSSSVSSSKKEKESASAKRERRWSKFDQRWESLDASSATSRLPLTYNDIPWPPKMAKLLERKVSEQEKQHQQQGTSISKKKVYRELILRWHPDKFMQKYGKRVRAGGDEDRIKERVDAVAKALSATMSSSVSS